MCVCVCVPFERCDLRFFFTWDSWCHYAEAFAAAMDVAVQAAAGAEPLTLANMASQTVGRDTATGGAGGEHPLTAAGAFGMLVLDTVIYAALVGHGCIKYVATVV